MGVWSSYEIQTAFPDFRDREVGRGVFLCLGFPILDVRALWSAGLDATPSYGFALWREYTEFLRGISTDAGVTMRTVDKALWQYSKVKQKG